MKLGRAACLLLCVLVVATALASAERAGRRNGRGGKNKNRKGSRGGRKAPKWKSSSMPRMKERIVLLHTSDALALDCKANGQPKPEITWFKDGQIFEANDRVVLRKHRLMIPQLLISDQGNYTCEVMNRHGHLSWTFIVEVTKKVWPLEIVGPQNITAQVGKDVEFTCKVVNDEAAVIRWQKLEDNEQRINGERAFLASRVNGVLLLSNVQKSDDGVYACQGSNHVGSRESYGRLTVVESIGFNVGGTEDGASEKDVDKARNNKNKKNSHWSDLDRDPLVKFTTGPGEFDPDFGPDLGTTRRPRKNRKNKTGRKNRNRGKNRKNKMKKKIKPTPPFYFETIPTGASETVKTTKKTTTTEIQVPYDPRKTTTSYIWDFGNMDRSNSDDGIRDTRYNDPSQQPKDETQGDGAVTTFTEGDAANAKDNGKNTKKEGSISALTIYTIVGAVCGVILLIGLVAVTLTLCCKREDEGVYKSPTQV